MSAPASSPEATASAAASTEPTASVAPSGPSADITAITKLITEVARSKDPARICGQLMTPAFVKDLFATQAKCREEDPDTVSPTGATTSGLVVTGNTASAQVALRGGDLDKSKGLWKFVRQSGKWRLNEWSTEFLRSTYVQTFENYTSTDPADPFSDASFRECVIAEGKKLSDTKFRSLARNSFQSEKNGYDSILRPCFLASPDGKPSAIRRGFELGFRETDVGLSDEQIDCILERLRKDVTDVQLYELGQDPAGAGASEVQDKTRSAALQCGTSKSGSTGAMRAAKAGTAKSAPARVPGR